MAERAHVDDDPVQRRLLENMVTRSGYEAIVAEGGDAAATLLTGPDGARIDAVVLDLMMPDLDGLGVLARMREAGLATPVVVQTAHGGIDNVVTAMRAGASDFVVKPVGVERLQVSLRSAAPARWRRARRSPHRRTLTFRDIITRSEHAPVLVRGGAAVPVLIEASRASARSDRCSTDRRRRNKPDSAVSCGATDSLISRSCSATKSAFWAPMRAHRQFRRGDRRTLFLGEIDRLRRPRRSLLRAIREGESSRSARASRESRRAHHLGHQPRPDRRRERGRFREDLFYACACSDRSTALAGAPAIPESRGAYTAAAGKQAHRPPPCRGDGAVTCRWQRR